MASTQPPTGKKLSIPAKPKAAEEKKPVVSPPPTTTDRKAALEKQIEALQSQMHELDQDAIHELKLKLSGARKEVSQLEEQLAELTGKPFGMPKIRRERRPSIADDALQDQLLKVMAVHGKEGMNATQLADKLNQDALRVRKFIKDKPEVLKRQGSSSGTKFFLT